MTAVPTITYISYHDATSHTNEGLTQGTTAAGSFSRRARNTTLTPNSTAAISSFPTPFIASFPISCQGRPPDRSSGNLRTAMSQGAKVELKRFVWAAEMALPIKLL